jgi:hypothetical protein
VLEPSGTNRSSVNVPAWVVVEGAASENLRITGFAHLIRNGQVLVLMLGRLTGDVRLTSYLSLHAPGVDAWLIAYL